MDIELVPAQLDDATMLANLLELYLHDLSEAFPIEPDTNGRFGYERLPLYWTETDRRFPFLIRRDDRVVGFVFVTRDQEGWDIAEFFVLRRHRRDGVGRRAAFALWDRMPGRWTVRVFDENRGAVPFWSRIIAEYSNGAFTRTEKDRWQVFSFLSSATPQPPPPSPVRRP
jgi:predicted acetyltransferase